MEKKQVGDLNQAPLRVIAITLAKIAVLSMEKKRKPQVQEQTDVRTIKN